MILCLIGDACSLDEFRRNDPHSSMDSDDRGNKRIDLIFFNRYAQLWTSD